MADDVVDVSSHLVGQIEVGVPGWITVDHKVTRVEVNLNGIGHGAAVLEVEVFGLDVADIWSWVAYARVAGTLPLTGQIEGA